MSEAQKPTFEQQIQRLESIVGQMEAPDLPLEQAMALYEQGVQLARDLNQVLTQAQQKIEILARDEQGEITPKPMADPQT
ncbi:MAG: exodeoxyribonuclease VII small subunit [Acidobacteria bacterium]|nr:exodeoxyribonuclease VII small subunit [Acidobacteriota bacterium]MCB9398244.1 exodeoxyribonuclease VII small subunit [Acidobacteriota bacterium]